MSGPVDAAGTAELATQLGLVDTPTLRECLIEIGDKKAPAEQFVHLLERKRLLTPFQGSKLLKGETDGYFLGGYRLLYKIASGSFGRVYRGDDPRTGQIVAIKVLRKRWTEDPKRIESFEREGRIGLTLEHPNIVRILAVNKDAPTGQHYMVMEFVEGGNLRDILAIRKKMDPVEAVRIMEECAAGLAYAHSRGLSHRDIKSSNILLGTDKVAKLVDFGLAGIHEGATAGHMAHRPGDKEEGDGEERTVDYAGLERATNVKSGDVRSDIYFLGHVLYEMVSGSSLMPPTRDKNVRMSRKRFEDAEAALFQSPAATSLPVHLTRLIARAISLDPKMRFQTPTAYYEALRILHRELTGEVPHAHADAHTHTPGHSQPGMNHEPHFTIFIVESNTKLQDALREKFKKIGFRVLMTLDAEQAIKRYQQQPFQALVVDAGSVAQDGVEAFRRVTVEAQHKKQRMAAVLILNEDQAGWSKAVANQPGGVILIRPVKMRDVIEALAKNMPELQVHEHHEEE